MSYSSQPRWMDFLAVAIAVAHVAWAATAVAWPWIRAIWEAARASSV